MGPLTYILSSSCKVLVRIHDAVRKGFFLPVAFLASARGPYRRWCCGALFCHYGGDTTSHRVVFIHNVHETGKGSQCYAIHLAGGGIESGIGSLDELMEKTTLCGEDGDRFDRLATFRARVARGARVGIGSGSNKPPDYCNFYILLGFPASLRVLQYEIWTTRLRYRLGQIGMEYVTLIQEKPSSLAEP